MKFINFIKIDEAELWLKKNDPEYSDNKSKNKSKYPYLTRKQELYRQSKEELSLDKDFKKNNYEFCY